MGRNNNNLRAAKKAKNDEFYTLYEDVEAELSHYDFSGKIIYCNCDSETSSFCKYFTTNFKNLGIKHLYCTSLGGILYEYDGSSVTRKALQGNGSYNSAECLQILRKSDIVVTNPPFSLFRDFIDTLEKEGKKYLILGATNAAAYKNVFPLIKDGKLFPGYGFNIILDFIVPASSSSYTRIDSEGIKYKKIPVAWWTNIKCPPRSPLNLVSDFSETSNPRYDNYCAFNVNRVVDIPRMRL